MCKCEAGAPVKLSKLSIEINAECEYLQIGDVKIKLVSRRRRGRGKTRYEVTAPRDMKITRETEPADVAK